MAAACGASNKRTRKYFSQFAGESSHQAVAPNTQSSWDESEVHIVSAARRGFLRVPVISPIGKIPMKTSLSSFVEMEAAKDAATIQSVWPLNALPAADCPVEHLPFTVKIVENASDLQKAIEIRHRAYARHVPEFAETLRFPEAADHAPDTVVVLAQSRLDFSPLGTLRIQKNDRNPLPVEQSVRLPLWATDSHLIEISRLGVVTGVLGRVVKAALMKAAYLYCIENRIDWVIATGRRPIDRQYENMLFKDVFPGLGFMPIAHVGNIPHRVMTLPIPELAELWSSRDHVLSKFFFATQHPGISIQSSENSDPPSVLGANPAVSPPGERAGRPVDAEVAAMI
jgi:hypothetical protein